MSCQRFIFLARIRHGTTGTCEFMRGQSACGCCPMPSGAPLNHAVVLATMDRFEELVCGRQVPEDWGVGAISTTVWLDEREGGRDERRW